MTTSPAHPPSRRPTSAGLLLYRRIGQASDLEVLLVHPGGPFWARRHEGAWSIPKGEFDPATETGIAAARREFTEELGLTPPSSPWIELGETRLRSGKRILAWAAEGDLDPAAVTSNTFELEWPPRSGRIIEVPEVDEARWVAPRTAESLLNPAQVVFLERLMSALESGPCIPDTDA